MGYPIADECTLSQIVLLNPRFEVTFLGLEHALPLLHKKATMPVPSLPLLAALTPADHNVPDPALRREYRRRILGMVRARRDPAVLFGYVLKCAMHYHHCRMGRDMVRDGSPIVNPYSNC
jgi:hypothetical protein